MTIVIEKAVPLPAARAAGRGAKYPFKEMRAGDSFAVPFDPAVSERRNMQRLTMSATSWAKRSDSALKFVARLVEEEGVRKVRLWAK